MEALTRLSLAVFALATFAAPAPAQSPAQSHAPEWVAASPDGEGFTARMPKRPAAVAQQVYANGVDASGARYESADDGRTTFVVWSMKGSTTYGPLGPGGYASKGFPAGAAYLDAADELAWELLITPEFERLARAGVSNQRMAEMGLGMSYGGEFELSGMPARRYYVSLEKGRGLAYICGEGAQVYVVAALGADKSDPRLKQFLDSFALKSAATRPAVGGVGVGAGPGRGVNVGGAAGNTGGGDAPVDYSKPFKPAEVMKKVVITEKPEPGFTEQARKFDVTGTVRLRAIFASAGEVTNISVVKGLPHGLTEKAIAAARQIRFAPAEKDGQKVSQYVTLEYNFNIY
jgi:TonB family protein